MFIALGIQVCVLHNGYDAVQQLRLELLR